MRSILSDISMSELISMRNDQNMSNREIAEVLGCSYQTIRKLLGPQPKGMRAERRPADPVRPVRQEPVRPVHRDESVVPASLVLTERSLVLQGEVGRYEIDTYAGKVCIQIPEQGRFVLSLDSLNSLCGELNAILRNHEKTAFTVEAW